MKVTVLIDRESARQRGLRFYNNGKPCKRGHFSKKYVSNQACFACQKTLYEQRYAQGQAAWRDKNKEKVTLHGRRHYKANKSEYITRAKDWKASNRKKVLQSGKKYRQKHPHLKSVEAAQRKAATLQRTPGWLSESHRNEIKLIYAQRDQLKELTGINFHVDHIVPLQGQNVSGLHVPWNLRIITAHENLSKNNRLIEEAATCQLPEAV